MLAVYTLEQSEKWDEIVRSFAKYDVYWLSGYVNSFRIHGDGEPLLFYYNDGEIRGINVVFKRDVANNVHFKGTLPENTYFDFATPYGYGGWLIEGGNPAKLFEAYSDWCVNNGIISEFVRFHPLEKNHVEVSEWYDVIPLGPSVAMDISSPEIIWQNISGNRRNKVNKAKRRGVSVSMGKNLELFKVFRELYNETMEKNNADEYYFFADEFYESILNGLAENFEIFYALHEDKIIAATIMLIANGRISYHLSGTFREYEWLAPTNVIIHEAALWGSANGYKTLNLGGGVGSGDDNLLEFKKSFYRVEELPIFHIGKKIFNQDKYDELVGLRKELPESNFFPKYRA